MGLSDRHYMHNTPYSGSSPHFAMNVVYILIAINTLVYFLLPAASRVWLYEFALSTYGIKHFKFWQLVSYMFLHADFMHILFNMWGLYLFGTTILPLIGPARFLKLYFLSGVCGAGLWLLVNWSSHAPLIGASGAVFGVVMAAAMLNPNMRIQLLFPPIPMSMKTLVIVFALIEIVSEVSNVQGQVAHLAHLGGFISAYFYLKYVYGDHVWDMFEPVRKLLRKPQFPKKQKRVSKSKLPDGWDVYTNPTYQASVSMEEVNRILDKISDHGMDSLSKEELDTLKRASGEIQH